MIRFVDETAPVIPYTDQERERYVRTGSPVAPTDSPDVIPYTPEDVKGLLSDHWLTPSKEMARILYDEKNQKSTWDKAKEIGSNIGPGLKALGQQFVDAHNEIKDTPLSGNSADRAFSTIFEAGAQGYKNDKQFITSVTRPVLTKVGDFLSRATPEEQFEHYYQNLLKERAGARAAQNLPETRPDNFDENSPRLNLSPEFYQKGGIFSSKPAPPYAKAAQAASNLVDPIALSTAGAGEALGMSVRAAAKPALGVALNALDRIPGGIEATEKASEMLNKAVPAAEAINSARQKVTSMPGDVVNFVPRAVSATGKAVSTVAGFPEAVVKSIAERIIPEAGKETLDQIRHTITAAGFANHTSALGHAIVQLKLLEGAGWTAKRIGDLASRVAAMPADSQVPRLLAVANDASAPKSLSQ